MVAVKPWNMLKEYDIPGLFTLDALYIIVCILSLSYAVYTLTLYSVQLVAI